MLSSLPTKSPEVLRAELECRAVLAKAVGQRTYDDLIAIKRCVNGIESLHEVLVDLQPWQQDELFRSMNLEVYEAGDVIFNQGDRGDKFFSVLDGEVEILQLRSEAEVTVTQRMTVPPNSEGLFLVPITRVPSGGYFGERALEHSEPRSAAAKALTKSDLIVISGDTYKSILSAVVKHVDLSKQLTFKSACRRVLTQKPSARTEDDLQMLVEYFKRRVAYFRSTPYETLLQICRVLQLVTIHGKTTIFRQNSVGQGFYILLTGVVEIRVATQDKNGNYVEIPVNVVREGFSFGDRAMESESGMRMATAIAAEDFTELLVLSRHDYSQLLAPVYAKELQARCQLLSRTMGFHGLSAACHEELARFMEPRHYRIDQPICTAGENATEMYITCRGEVFASRNLQIDLGRTNTTKAVTLRLGKIGPGTLIGGPLVLVDSMGDEVITQEDVVAGTMCKVYVLAKFDLLQRLSDQTLQSLRNEIISVQQAPSLVYDSIRPSSGRSDWARTTTWDQLKTKFLRDYRIDFQGKRQMLSTLTLRSARGLNKGSDDDEDAADEQSSGESDSDEDDGDCAPTPLDTARLSDARLRTFLPGKLDDVSHGTHYGSRSGSRASALSGRRPSRRSNVSKGSAGSNSRGRAYEHFGGVAYGPTYTYNEQELQHYSCCLVHLYREKLRLQSGNGSRKYARCFFRLLGGYESRDSAKKAVRDYFQHMTFTLGMHQGGGGGETSQKATQEASHILMSSELPWQEFKGWDMFSLDQSDHFVIYERTGPVEYFSDTIDELHFLRGTGDDFPAACRPRGQKFACVRIAKLSASTYTDTAAAKKQRLFLKELSAFMELRAITRNKTDAIRYTQHLIAESQVSSYENTERTRLFAIPLFRWIHFNDDALARWDGKLQAAADDASINTEDADRTSEIKRLLVDSGLAPNRDGNFLEFVEASKWFRSAGTTEDPSTKFLMDILNEKSKAKFTHKPEERKHVHLDSAQAASIESIESTHEKAKTSMLAHRMLCEARSKIIRMSNELFAQEEHTRTLRAEDQMRGSTGNLHQIMGRLNRKQWEVLKTISELPDRKALIKGISKSSRHAAGHASLQRSRGGQHPSLQPLANKLDALDEMLRAEVHIQSS